MLQRNSDTLHGSLCYCGSRNTSRQIAPAWRYFLISFSAFVGVNDVHPLQFDCQWTDLCGLFHLLSRDEYARAEKLTYFSYIPGRLCGSRSAANVTELTFGSFDIDIGADDAHYLPFDMMRERLERSGYNYILATSTKSLAASHRYRLILEYDQPVAGACHKLIWQRANAEFDGVFDPATHDPSRLSFFPANWLGKPRDSRGAIIHDWPEQDAFQAIAHKCSGRPYPAGVSSADLMVEVETESGIRKVARRSHANSPPDSMALPSQAAALLSSCDAAVPSRDSRGYRLAITPGNALYCGTHEFGSIQGGRMFRFLSATAARALGRKLPINADLLFDLATAVDREHGGHDRPGLMREVQRALAHQAERIATPPTGG